MEDPHLSCPVRCMGTGCPPASGLRATRSLHRTYIPFHKQRYSAAAEPPGRAASDRLERIPATEEGGHSIGVGFKVSTGVCGFMAATISHLIVHSSSLRPVLPYDGLDGTPAVLRPCTASVPPWMIPDVHVHHQWP